MSTAGTPVEVSNGALAKIGQGPPFVVTMADVTKAAKLCNERIEPCRKFILRLHPWNFAMGRRTITLAAITNAVNNGAGLIRITATAHGKTTGTIINITGVQGTTEANATWTITVIDANTFDLQTSTFTNTYVSGGTYCTKPAFDFDFQFTLPTDSLRVIRVNDGDEPYRVEGRQILYDGDTIDLRYVTDMAISTSWDSMAYELLQAYLAYDICFALTQSLTLKGQLFDQFMKLSRQSKFVDATEEPADELQANLLINSRLDVSSSLVRDPGT
jgi:hypothetical protein